MDSLAAIMSRRRLRLPAGRDPSGDGFVDLLEIELAGRAAGHGAAAGTLAIWGVEATHLLFPCDSRSVHSAQI
jgi:hypothetical protein